MKNNNNKKNPFNLENLILETRKSEKSVISIIPNFWVSISKVRKDTKLKKEENNIKDKSIN